MIYFYEVEPHSHPKKYFRLCETPKNSLGLAMDLMLASSRVWRISDDGKVEYVKNRHEDIKNAVVDLDEFMMVILSSQDA